MSEFTKSFQEMAEKCYQNSANKGLWEEIDFYKKICLMHCEISEMVEAYRVENPSSDKIPDFSLAEEELADAVIRIMDFAVAKNMKLGEAIEAKYNYNLTRPKKHGKAF